MNWFWAAVFAVVGIAACVYVLSVCIRAVLKVLERTLK